MFDVHSAAARRSLFAEPGSRLWSGVEAGLALVGCAGSVTRPSTCGGSISTTHRPLVIVLVLESRLPACPEDEDDDENEDDLFKQRSTRSSISSARHPAARRASRTDPHFALAGAVEFAEEDALPGAELEAACADEYADAAAQQAGLEMRGTVAFAVLIVAAPRHEPFERGREVAHNVGIGILVDRNAGRCVRNEDRHGAFAHAEFAQRGLDLRGEVDEIGAAAGGER